MLHHLLHLPFVILHFVFAGLLVATALVVLRPLAMVARYRCASRQGEAFGPRSSTNAAFEEYRRTTLRKLEKEAEEFRSYLDRLRHASDAADFEAFLDARRGETRPAG